MALPYRIRPLLMFSAAALLLPFAGCDQPMRSGSSTAGAKAADAAAPATPVISAPAEDDRYLQAMARTGLAEQVELLVDALRHGSPHAGARLIALGRWEEMKLVDPRQPPLAAWSGSRERIGALTVGQIHGDLLANWAIRHRAKILGGRRDELGGGASLTRVMRQALRGMWDGPLEDPMLLAELYWLVDDYVDSSAANALHWWLLPRFLDGAETLDRHAMRARLVQFVGLLAKGWPPPRIYAPACDKATALAREHGFIAVELALAMWRPAAASENRGGRPPLNGSVDIPADDAAYEARVRDLLDLSRRAGEDRYTPSLLDRLAWLRQPDRLRFGPPAVDTTAAWREAAALYAQEAEIILANEGRQEPPRPPDRARVAWDGDGVGHPRVVHAQALIDQAWCLHQGIARDPRGVPEAIALYERALAELDAFTRAHPDAFRYSTSPADGATATLRWLRGESAPTQRIEGQYHGIDLPDAGVFTNITIYFTSLRVGPGEDRGIGEEHAWHDRELTRQAVSGNWKDGRRDGAWTWWHQNGALAVSGSFRCGIQIGRWRFLHPDGKVFMELDAGTGDEPFTGVRPSWKPDGSAGPASEWLHGHEVLPAPRPLREGPRTIRRDDGRRIGEGVYAHDLETGPWTWWHDDGETVRERATMRLGLRDGEGSTWDSRGKPESIGHWRCGLRDGEWTWFHPSGAKRETTTYRMGQMQGIRTCWHDNGKVAETSHHHDGELVGTSRHWYPSGRLREIEQFGERPGDKRWSLFDEDGTRRPLPRPDGTFFPPAIEGDDVQ